MASRSSLDPVLTEIWRFVRGDADVSTFEQWLYANSDEFCARLGNEGLLEVLSADYRSSEDIFRVRTILRDYASRVSSLLCRCPTLPDRAVVGMGTDSEEVLGSIEERRSRGVPLWWLWCGECARCGQWWLVGQEERQNDVFCLRRLSSAEVQDLIQKGTWPSDFDTYESLLRLGREAGHRVRFVDPDGSSLRWTIADLAKARPGIKVSEIAALLNLEFEIACALARQAVRQDGVAVEFDCE